MHKYEDAITKAKHLAQTPEGQQLIKLMQQKGGTDLEKALESAASGNMSQIQHLLSTLMKDPNALDLLKKLES